MTNGKKIRERKLLNTCDIEGIHLAFYTRQFLLFQGEMMYMIDAVVVETCKLKLVY